MCAEREQTCQAQWLPCDAVFRLTQRTRSKSSFSEVLPLPKGHDMNLVSLY